MTDVLRVGNASGFYGDRFAAFQEMLDGGPLDVLTGDYLAELTMLTLGRDLLKNPKTGYAKTFLRQLEGSLGLAVDHGVRIVANAGGLNPAGLSQAVQELAGRLGIDVSVAHVEGDDLRPRTEEFGFGDVLTANAYLGCWGIAEALKGGADIVVTGRVTDASLVVGPAAAHFRWGRDQWDALAGATVAGHVVECGAQATGGNFSFFTEVPDLLHAGFPIAEIHEDGSSVITKHPGTGGAVTVETVTAQLLYEIGGPDYLGPDVVSRFDTVELSQLEADRVRISGVRGNPPPPDAKVCLNRAGGFRNATTFVLCGLDIDAKAALVREQLTDRIGSEGVTWTLARTGQPGADTEEAASALLHVTIKDADGKRSGRAFSQAAVELALASYPGFHATAPPPDATPFGVYSASYVSQQTIAQTVIFSNGHHIDVHAPALTAPVPELVTDDGTDEPVPAGRFRLGDRFGAQSGDKGADANLGVWARDDEGYELLRSVLTTQRLRTLLPEITDLAVDRYPLPNLRAVNFVIRGLLGEGVSASTRFDPQAKALGEWLRSIEVGP
jgi:Acyclic terpene utilisation family protein AtuA